MLLCSMASTVGDCKEAKVWPSALPPELSAFWAWKEDLGSETGSKGEVPCSFVVLHFGVPVCYLPHAIWRYDADVGSLDFKSTAASEQSWPVHTMKQPTTGAREMQLQRLTLQCCWGLLEPSALRLTALESAFPMCSFTGGKSNGPDTWLPPPGSYNWQVAAAKASLMLPHTSSQY